MGMNDKWNCNLGKFEIIAKSVLKSNFKLDRNTMYKKLLCNIQSLTGALSGKTGLRVLIVLFHHCHRVFIRVRQGMKYEANTTEIIACEQAPKEIGERSEPRRA